MRNVIFITSFLFCCSLAAGQAETADSLNIEMVFVQGGTFAMGCTPEQDNDCNDVEKPIHDVTISDFTSENTK